jgi:hypothetical protein
VPSIHSLLPRRVSELRPCAQAAMGSLRRVLSALIADGGGTTLTRAKRGT